MPISKELQILSQEEWFPHVMKELRYVKVQKDHWIKTENGRMYCSVCGAYPPYDIDQWATPYCPWCGADLRGEEDDRT